MPEKNEWPLLVVVWSTSVCQKLLTGAHGEEKVLTASSNNAFSAVVAADLVGVFY